MRPFNLEEAKAGHPIITRDGRPAKFVAWAPSLRSVLGLLAEVDGFLVAVRKDGLHDAVAHNSLDLLMAQRSVVKFVSLTLINQSRELWHDTQEQARDCLACRGERIARVEWEE